MHELTKEDLAKRDDFIAQLEQINEKIEVKEQEMNDKVAELNDMIQEYNNALKEVDQFATDITTRITDYMADKSEGWKEEKGDAYEEWHGHWSNVVLSPLDLIDEPSIDDRGHARELGDLPVVPED